MATRPAAVAVFRNTTRLPAFTLAGSKVGAVLVVAPFCATVALTSDLVTVEEVEVLVLHVHVEQGQRVGEHAGRVTLRARQLHLHLRVSGGGIHDGDEPNVRAAAISKCERTRLGPVGITDIDRQGAA